MGYYINPKGMSKEEWLHTHGLPIHPDEAPRALDMGAIAIPVCLVHNGAFTAAGICYSKAELEAFTQPHDRRPKLWFIVPRSKLVEEGFISEEALP